MNLSSSITAKGTATGEPSAEASTSLRAWPLLRCLAMYRSTPWRFVLTFLLYVALNLGLALQQWLLGRAVQDVQDGRAVVWGPQGQLDVSPMLWWLGVLAAVALTRAAIQYAAAIVGLLIQQRLLCTLRERIFEQVQRLHLGYHWQHGAGEVITRTTRDADKLRDALTSFWRQGVDSLLIVAAAMGYLWWYHPWLAVFPMAATAAALYLLVRQADALVGLDRAVGSAYDRVNQDLAEGVHGVRVIKAFVLERQRSGRFAQQVEHFMKLAVDALAYACVRVPVPQFLVGMGQVWVLGAGLWLVSQGQLQTGELVAALLMVNLLVLRIEGIGKVIKTYADARSSAARIWELLDTRPAIVGGAQSVPSGPLGLQLESVRVLPPSGGQPVLEEAQLTIAPGEVVALVGATGAGKSTLCSLASRLIDPHAGRVLLGFPGHWHDISSMRLDALRTAVQVVPQESFLFSDSLADNLRLAQPHASDADLWAALEAACAADFVRALPQGLDTRLGDRGVTLSGGQRQRLCLARAFLAQPSLLVLDDATSALDSVTERDILQRLRRQGRNGGLATTVLMVTNRLASLRDADRVLVLQEGRIADSGSHHQLAARNAHYRALMGVNGDGH